MQIYCFCQYVLACNGVLGSTVGKRRPLFYAVGVSDGLFRHQLALYAANSSTMYNRHIAC